jgi:hypothetical protein
VHLNDRVLDAAAVGKEDGMHASTDQIRDLTHDAVERLTERAPSLAVAVQRPKRRHRVRVVLLASVVLVVILAVARKLLGHEPQEATAGPAADDSHDDDAAERASSNGDGPNAEEPDDAEPLQDANVGKD